ncbi:iron-sulfur cluster carrier protein [Demequina litorisediminis]|uniref:Iron-sulfur cluster carrier protein n=1 Tax=Demequina litorisediminis TaxID=1849022 RepID=A0ABQ6IGW3_9MICO|nr:iron-sulfur cluster carrier protein [Demequina litorisediminis]
MDEEQRLNLRSKAARGKPEPVIQFTQPGNMTRIYAIASGKGGVGKSTVTANLGAAMAKDGLKVGILDADIFGFSIPGMLGVTGQPTRLDDMLLPPIAHEVKAVSIGMFVPEGQPVVWRGPMLHRAIEQFLADVYWGDLDVLLLDLPPGTGDIAISVAQPASPRRTGGRHDAAVRGRGRCRARGLDRDADLAERRRRSREHGVDGSARRLAPAHLRRGRRPVVADRLTKTLGTAVPVLGQVPLDITAREAGDAGTPVVISDPESSAAQAITAVARALAGRQRGLAGRSLGVTPVKR